MRSRADLARRSADLRRMVCFAAALCRLTRWSNSAGPRYMRPSAGRGNATDQVTRRPPLRSPNCGRHLTTLATCAAPDRLIYLPVVFSTPGDGRGRRAGAAAGRSGSCQDASIWSWWAARRPWLWQPADWDCPLTGLALPSAGVLASGPLRSTALAAPVRPTDARRPSTARRVTERGQPAHRERRPRRQLDEAEHAVAGRWKTVMRRIFGSYGRRRTTELRLATKTCARADQRVGLGSARRS
jgi:hypothetical protein